MTIYQILQRPVCRVLIRILKHSKNRLIWFI